jgi:hypothetical protein
MFNQSAPGVVANRLALAQRAHAAAQMRAQSGPGAPVAPQTAMPAQGPVAPVAAQPPVAPVVPHGAQPGSAPHGGYKRQLAGHLAALGHHVSVGHIHAAIDGLTQAGHFTPQQGAALKAHNGPLQGHAGKATMGKIAGAILA